MRVADQESWRLLSHAVFPELDQPRGRNAIAAYMEARRIVDGQLCALAALRRCADDIDELSHVIRLIAAVTRASTERLAPATLRGRGRAARCTIAREPTTATCRGVDSASTPDARRGRDHQTSPCLPGARIDPQSAGRRDSTRRSRGGITRGTGRDRPARTLGLAYACRPEAPPVRAAVYRGARNVAVESVADPAPPGPDEVVLHVSHASICGTDAAEWWDGPHLVSLSKTHAATGNAGPVVLGHEFVGEVASVGAEVTNLRVGGRVVSGAGVSCGACSWCRLGRTNLCERYYTLGLQADGGLAELVTTPPISAYLSPTHATTSRRPSHSHSLSPATR